MKRTLYHGTSVENAKQILIEGFQDTDRLWEPSYYEHCYFWDRLKLADANGMLDDDWYSENNITYNGIRHALECSVDSTVYYGNSPYLVALEYEIDENYVADDSTGGMEHSGAVECDIEEFNENATLTNIYICDFPLKLSLLFVSFNKLAICPPEIEKTKEIIKNIDTSFAIDMLDEIISDYRTIDAVELNNL